MERLTVTVVGAGIFGLWQAYELARRGHRVIVIEAMPETLTGGASRFAGAMLAPYCEAEASEPALVSLGLRGLEAWKAAYPAVVQRGSLVVAGARDQGEITRFARLTQGHRAVDGDEIAAHEPDLAGRFGRGLFFPTEAHIAPRPALDFLISELRRLGAELRFGVAVPEPVWMAGPAGSVVIDARGMAARGDLSGLRGVRGEMAVVHSREVSLTRPVRLLHPRFPLYVVPWGGGLFMVGATLIEREDAGPVTVRSALDLLGTAYAVHPAFGEAEIVELSAGVRPAFPSNMPSIVAAGRRISINGAYRHGYLLAPVVAEAVVQFLETGARHNELFAGERVAPNA